MVLFFMIYSILSTKLISSESLEEDKVVADVLIGAREGQVMAQKSPARCHVYNQDLDLGSWC